MTSVLLQASERAGSDPAALGRHKLHSNMKLSGTWSCSKRSSSSSFQPASSFRRGIKSLLRGNHTSQTGAGPERCDSNSSNLMNIISQNQDEMLVLLYLPQDLPFYIYKLLTLRADPDWFYHLKAESSHLINANLINQLKTNKSKWELKRYFVTINTLFIEKNKTIKMNLSLPRYKEI